MVYSHTNKGEEEEGSWPIWNKFKRALKMNIIFDKHEFSEPTRIDKWEPPKAAGIYVILKHDLSRSPIPLKPIYFGQTSNFAERDLLKSHEILNWVKEAESDDGIFIAIYIMLGSIEEERKIMEAELIAKYRPVCN